MNAVPGQISSILLQCTSPLLAHSGVRCGAKEWRPSLERARNLETALSGLGAGPAECSPRECQSKTPRRGSAWGFVP
jgi:hypothetical protein